MHRKLIFPPRADVLKRLRAQIRGLAAFLGADRLACDRLALIVDELVNNAVEHGAAYRQRGLDLSIELGAEDDRITIEFTDPEMPGPSVRELARALASTAPGMPTLDSERGRGLFLMQVYLEGLRAEEAYTGGLRLVGMLPRS
jgi:anti-sigma regulatory factor (Ser/Thr protein kinase)